MSATRNLKGTRDFLPEQSARRNYIFDTIKTVYKKFGFQGIETPSMEKLATLTGKYGEEGDRLLFKVLNSGDKLKKADVAALQEENLPRFANSVSEKGMRYDLTVPFARFVVQHRNDLAFPFKRYQIQPVWRADRPQRGRYQEFYQCDADVIGTTSLLCEVELCQIIDEVFEALKVPVALHLNNRKMLTGIAEVIGEHDKLVPITVEIDKLDKIGKDAVLENLRKREVSESAIVKLEPLFSLDGSNEERLDQMEVFLKDSSTGLLGVEEMRTVLSHLNDLGVAHAEVNFDVTLARGLDYYTGTIFEVKATTVSIGTVCAGGRYDNLTAVFGWPGNSGVGISFGADRIYDVIDELEAFPELTNENTQLLFVNFGETEAKACMRLLKLLRAEGFNAELYPSKAKTQKQMKYADQKKIPFVALVGQTEMEKNAVTLKNMHSGEQVLVKMDELVATLQSNF